MTVKQPMSEERWARVEALFEGALDRPERERAAWLAEACGDDEALLREMRSLLEASASGLTDRLSAVGRVADELMAATGSTAVGERLGAYRLEEEIGRGGMGVVRRGARADGAFEQTVAVKLLPGAMFSLQRRARFALNNLANLYTDAGRLSEAETTLREALEINRSTFGADHPSVATNLNNLAALAWRRGEFGTAAELQQQVLEMDVRHLGEDHEYVAGDLTALGSYLLFGNDLAAAEAPLRAGMEKMLEIRGEEHLATANGLTAYADWLIAVGRGDEAAELARRALETRRAVLADDHIAVAHARSALGAALALVGETAEARRLLEDAAEVLARTLPPEDPARARTLARRGALQASASDGSAPPLGG